MTIMTMKPRAYLVALSLVAAAAGCQDIDSPSLLERPRLLAVRLSPPGLAAGESSRIDLLAFDGDAVVELQPDAVATSLPGDLVARDQPGFSLRCPAAEQLEAMRAELGAAADQPLVVPLEVSVSLSGETLAARKIALFGQAMDNPALGAIEVAGAAPGEDGDIVAAAGDLELTVGGGAEETSYAWFSTVAEIGDFTEPRAHLAAEPGDAGLLLVVARDQAGGVAWSSSRLRVSGP